LGNPHAVSPHLNRLAKEGIYIKQSLTVLPDLLKERAERLDEDTKGV
jgi:hypothetical protein